MHCCRAIQICYSRPLTGSLVVVKCIFTIAVNPRSLKQMMSRQPKSKPNYFIISSLSSSILVLHLLLHSTDFGIEIMVGEGIVQHLVV